MEEVLEKIKNFHGHLGPYVVIGYRMGVLANKHLGNDPFEKTAEVWTKNCPPMSCVLDGVQMGSGCTLGKRNITIKNSDIPKALFSNKNGKKIEIKLKTKVNEEIEKTVTKENLTSFSIDVFNRSDDELFEII